MLQLLSYPGALGVQLHMDLAQTIACGCRRRTGGRRKLCTMLCKKNTPPISCWVGFKGQANLLYKGEKMNRLDKSFRIARAEKYYSNSSFLLICFPFSLICNGTTCRIPLYFPYSHTLALTECLNQMFKPPMLSQPTLQRPFVPLGKAVRSYS